MLNFINKIDENLSALLLGAMAVITIIQIIFRYFISYSLSWPEELGRFLFIAAVYIGSSYAEKNDKHLAITILRTNAGKWCAKYVPVIAEIINIIFCAFMTYWGILMAVFVYESQQLAPALLIPMYLVYLVIPFGMGCMTIRAFNNLRKFIYNIKHDIQHNNEKAEV